MTMTSPIFGRASNTATSATRYIGLQYNYLDSWNATAANVEQVASADGTLQNLYMTLGTAPGVGTGYTFTVTKNGSATALTCDITGTNTTNNDTTHTVSYVAGDTLGIRSSIQSGTPAAGGPRWVVENVGAAQNLFTKLTSNSNTTSYVGLQAGTGNVTANLAQSIMPTVGNITAARVKLVATPAAGQSVTFTLVVNGVDSALTLTVSNPSTSASSSTSVAVAAGDLVYWKVVTSATSGSITASVGTTFAATTSGQSVQLFSPSVASGVSGNNFMPLTSGIGGASTVEANRLPTNSATTWSLYNLYVNLNTAPGGAASYTATIRSNSANTAVTTSISGSSTSGNDTTHTASAVATTTLGVNIVGSSTPAASIAQASFVTFLTPTSSGNSDFFQLF